MSFYCQSDEQYSAISEYEAMIQFNADNANKEM